MSRLNESRTPRRFWMCWSCADLRVSIVNTFTTGDPNGRVACALCALNGNEENKKWYELDEAFFLLEINASDEGMREARDMVEGRLPWRTSPEHHREVPSYALKKGKP